MNSTNKPIESPNIIHGPSDKGQHEFFLKETDKWSRSVRRVNVGKGSKRRPTNKSFKDNWDLIDWKRANKIK